MPRPLPWIKLWLDSLHNQKLIRLSLAERGAWWGLLSLTGELDAGGALSSGGQPLTLDEMAESLHIKEADRPHLVSMIQKMTKQGSLAWNGNTLHVVNWHERQHIKPSDRPEAVAERVRRFREKKRASSPTPLPGDGEKEGEGEGEKEVTALQGRYERKDEARRAWQKVVRAVGKERTMRFWLQGSRALGYDKEGFLVVEVPDEQRAGNLARKFDSIICRALGVQRESIRYILPQRVKEEIR